MPVIVFAVNVGDWSSREFFRGDIFQTAQIDTKNSTLSRDISDAERAHTTVLTEMVLIAIVLNRYLVSSDWPERRRNASGFTIAGQTGFLSRLNNCTYRFRRLGRCQPQSGLHRNDNYPYSSSAMFLRRKVAR